MICKCVLLLLCLRMGVAADIGSALEISSGTSLKTDAEAVTALETGLPRDRAVERGLVWVRAQAGSDGGLGESNRVALTALGLLAHYANGITPSDSQAARTSC